jgi:hypothetical protein
VGRDGGAYGIDLGKSKRNIFLQMGLDRKSRQARVICPSGKSPGMFHALFVFSINVDYGYG